MKRLWNGILTIALLATVVFGPMTVHADAVWEPENSFWESHRDDCEYLERSYRAAGAVEVYRSPENSRVIEVLSAGDWLRSSWIYTDEAGNEWIFCEHEEGGWISKASMEVIYDYLSFENEYGDQIREENRKLDEKYLEQTVYFWDYPGALDKDRVNLDDFGNADFPACQKMFTDEEGREWGYVGYWCGYKNFWICFDEPTAGAGALYQGKIPERGVRIDGENPVVVEKLIDPAGLEKVVPAENGSNLLVNFVVILCVLGVIIVTAVILLKMKKKN